MNIKKELLFSLILTLAVIGYVGFRYIEYKSRMQTTSLAQLANLQNLTTQTLPNNSLLTTQEIEKHNNPQDCWLLIENKVYSVTQYLSLHPGGAAEITPYCGKDATQAFLTQGGRGSHSAQAYTDLGMILIGNINETITTQPELIISSPLFQNRKSSIEVENEEEDDE